MAFLDYPLILIWVVRGCEHVASIGLFIASAVIVFVINIFCASQRHWLVIRLFDASKYASFNRISTPMSRAKNSRYHAS